MSYCDLHTEVFRLVEGAEAEVYTEVIILAIVLVYTDSHNTMVTTVYTQLWLPQPTCKSLYWFLGCQSPQSNVRIFLLCGV
jgi:hypothetical protein